MSDINYNENIYDAISTIIDSRLTQLKNDLTIVATVLLQDKDNPLKYLLSNANMKFWAYSNMENKTYTNNSSVYVLVPNGDYTQKKLILSEVPIETNKKTYGITNRFNLFIKTVAINPCSFLNADTTPTPFGPLYYNTNYNAIGYTLVPADNYNLSSTDMFSIEINFNLRNIDKQGIEQLEPLFDKPIVITNRDLRGNPYSLSKAITYDFVYSCPENLLRHLTDNLIITYKVINGIESIADFDFELYGWLGYTIDYPLVNTNELKIYSNKDTDYNNWSTVSKLALEDYEQTLLEIASNSELTEKQKSQAKKQALSQLTIKLKQANAPTERIEYTDNNEDIQIYLEVFGDKDSNVIASPYPPSNNFSTIAVYRYRVGSAVDKKLGPNWEMIGIYQKDILSFVYKNSDWIQLGHVDLGAGEVFFTDFETTKIKIICNVLNGDKTLEFVSPTLTYYNANKDVTTKTQDTGDLKLSLGDGDNGIYNIYGLDNHIKKQKKNSYMVRVTTNTGENLMSEDGKTYNSDFGINKIEWIYPTNLTGIVPIEERDATGKVTGKLKGLLDDSGRWGDVFYYTLKDKCYPTYTNNTIRCLVYYNGVPQPKEASIALDFGGFGNRNTPYSLNIDIVGNEKFLRLDNKILLIASLERTDGEAVKLPLTNWTWGFVSENTPCNFVTADGANLNNGDGKSFTTITGTEEIWLQGPGVDSLDTYNTVVKLTIPKVQVNDVSQQDLVAYLPIPLMCATNETAAANTYSYLGPDRVVYDGLNDNSYDESVIGLYINGENVVIGGLSIIDNEDVARGVYSSKALNLEDFNKQYSSSAHILAYTSSNEEQQTYNSVKLLVVPGTLINQKPFVNTIVIKDESLNDIWKLPIITFRNLWESLIYNWSGNGVLQDGNAIYSPYIAAGKKENDNTFTGIMLGGVDGFFSPSDKIYGLFGTSKGSPRFYLTENGEFYVGNGTLYIELDDLGDFYLNVQNFNLTVGDSYIKLNGAGQLDINITLNFKLNVPHLKINSQEENIKIYSNNGLKVLLGNLGSSNYGLNIYDGAINIYKDSSTKVIYFGGDGNLNVTGTIHANQGEIGGFNITPDRFYSDNNKINFYPTKTGTETIAQFGLISINGYGNVLVRRLLRFYDINSNIGIYVSLVKSGLASMCIGCTRFSGADILGDDNPLFIDANPGIVIGGLNNSDSSAINLYSSAGVIYWGPNGGYLRAVLNNTYKYSIGTNNISCMVATYNKDFSPTAHYIHVEANEDSGWGGARGLATYDSDRRLKFNIQDTHKLGLPIIRLLRHVEFLWISNRGKVNNGFIALEVEEIIPEAVLTVPLSNSTDIKQLLVHNILPYATKAIQELDEEIMALKQEIKELKQNEIYK